MIGLFLSTDPVTAHERPIIYFHRYRYAASNPYTLIDPNGESVKITGSDADQETFIGQAERFTGLAIAVGEDGMLSASRDVKNGAAAAFMSAISSEHEIGLQIVSNWSDVTFDDMAGVIDVADFTVAAATSERLVQAAFAHLFAEQRKLMDMGGRTRENYLNGAHRAGRDAEYAVMGATLRKDNGGIRHLLLNSIGINTRLNITYENNGQIIGNYSLPLDND